MNHNEKVTALLEQAKFAQASFFDRRNHEWYVSLAFWAMLVGVIAEPAAIAAWAPMPRIALFCILPLAYTMFWLYPVSCAHVSDKTLKDYFWKASHAIYQNTEPKVDPKLPDKVEPWKRFPSTVKLIDVWNWGIVFQIIVTVSLCLVAAIPRAE